MAHRIAESRITIEKIRLLTLKAAHSMDTLGSAGAKKEVRLPSPLRPPTAEPSPVLSTCWTFRFSWHLDGTQNIGSPHVIVGYKL